MKLEAKRTIKPFLKWAGGKTQLLPEIEKRIPFSKKESFTYIEPFVGSGAVFFWMLKNFPNIKKIVINDFNTDLINVYQQVKTNVNEVISILEAWQSEYHKIDENEDLKKAYYYEKRSLYNSRKSDSIVQAALLIFLNKTCFNGLYRVNKSNGFNVPVGSYTRPIIADADNLRIISEGIQQVGIRNVDFEQIFENSSEKTFLYFDPPYKPLNPTSSFNSYSMFEFNDNEQIRLKEFCDILHKKGHKWLLSNSDPMDDNGVHFFDELYKDYTIERVKASRNINSKGYKRGKLNEVLIRNY
jgi:DNA adenine methylase